MEGQEMMVQFLTIMPIIVIETLVRSRIEAVLDARQFVGWNRVFWLKPPSYLLFVVKMQTYNYGFAKSRIFPFFMILDGVLMYQCWEKGGTVNKGRPVMNLNFWSMLVKRTEYSYIQHVIYVYIYLSSASSGYPISWHLG